MTGWLRSGRVKCTGVWEGFGCDEHIADPDYGGVQGCRMMSKLTEYRASLVEQWLGIRLPVQETWVRALVPEDPTCRGTAKPVCHNYRACTLEPVSHNY